MLRTSIWSDSAGIGRANLDGTQPNPGFIAATPVGRAGGIAVDSAHITGRTSAHPRSAAQPARSAAQTSTAAARTRSSSSARTTRRVWQSTARTSTGLTSAWARSAGRTSTGARPMRASFRTRAPPAALPSTGSRRPRDSRPARSMACCIFDRGKVRDSREAVTATLGDARTAASSHAR